jgi:hypothetical protein
MQKKYFLTLCIKQLLLMDHLKNGQILSVFEWLDYLNTRPFDFCTQIDYLKLVLVRYSDVDFTTIVEFKSQSETEQFVCYLTHD